MDFQFTEQQNRFRQEVRDFFQNEPRGKRVDWEIEENYSPEFYKKLAAKGWIGLHWPVEYGGQGRDWVDLAIFHEEMASSRAPYGPMLYDTTVSTFGDLCVTYGGEQQKKEFLPRIARGEIRVARGFTEPNAGHDLAAITTRAVADGDDFVINGQKMFTTGAHIADYIFFMTRTGPDIPKEKGISLFMVDLKTPGITINPLRTLAGFRTNEVFLEDVRVPKRNMIGEENKGWDYLTPDPYFRYAMVLGRSPGELRLILQALTWLFGETSKGMQPPSKKDLVRHRLAEMAIKIEILRLMTYHIASLRSKGLTADYQLYMLKLWEGELWQRMANVGMQIPGLHAQLARGSKYAVLRGMTEAIYSGSVLMLLPGSSNTLRNGIAARGLGLTD
jgi:alkylation response protein AidB-like acyl-CoA dehydrogenase